MTGGIVVRRRQIFLSVPTAPVKMCLSPRPDLESSGSQSWRSAVLRLTIYASQNTIMNSVIGIKVTVVGLTPCASTLLATLATSPNSPSKAFLTWAAKK